jgi:peptidoglycan L-alanyl-D-glutamate endopeptidase CwlK
MAYNLSDRSRTRLEGVHPFMIAVINKALIDSPEDFGIPMYGGLRTSADQKKLYDKGRTLESLEKGEKVVTYTDGIRKESNHQMKESTFGEAFDVYIYDHPTGRASWNIDRLSSLAIHLIKTSEIVKESNKEFKGLSLVWGGSWTRFKDYPHFQIEHIK